MTDVTPEELREAIYEFAAADGGTPGGTKVVTRFIKAADTIERLEKQVEQLRKCLEDLRPAFAVKYNAKQLEMIDAALQEQQQ